MAALTLHNKKDAVVIHSREEWGRWLIETLPSLMVNSNVISSFAEVEQSFNASGAGDFQQFLHSETFTELKENGLLLL